MPSLCSGRRCPQYLGRRTGVLTRAARPRLRIEEGADGGDNDANESDENISPDADKSELHFTLEKRRGKDGNNNDNGGNNRGGNTRSRNRASGDNQDNQTGRGGDSNTDNSRFPGGSDGRPFFRGKDGGGRGFNKEGDGKGNQNNGSPGDSKGPGSNDADRGGGDPRGGGNNNGDAGNGNGNGRGGDNNGNGKGGNDNGGRGGGGGGGGGDPANDSTSSDSSSNDATTSSLPLSTSVTSTAEATTTTTTPLVESTFTPFPEPTTSPPEPTTISSAPQETSVPILTPLPALEDPSLTAPPISTTLVPPVASDLENTLDTAQDSTSLVSPTVVVGSSAAAPTETTPGIDPGDAGSGNNNNGNGGSGNVNNNNNNNNNAPIATQEKGLNPTSERILVAAGAIGVFIVLCFVAWILYRGMKKPKQSDGSGNNKSWLSSLFPWRGKSTMNDVEVFHSSYQPKEPLPVYDVGNNNSMEAVDYYNQEKLYPGAPEGIYPSTTAPQLGRMVWQTPEGQSIPVANPLNHYLQPDGQTFDSNYPNSTLRSRMPDPYYSQSEFARQPSDAYNPAQRQVYRASEISSLSSGFGDGDIIMPPPNTMPKPTNQSINAEANNRPFSWMSRTGTEQKRDTVSTTISERPPRFRSINSWVAQQKERIGRSDSRARRPEEVPVVPPMPALISVNPQNI